MKNQKIPFLFWVLMTFYACQNNDQARFQLVSATHSGIKFNNEIQENDEVNVFKFMNVYTGAGVAVGDVNNDGLVDVYFSGNVVSGRLYLNKGDLKFEDISESAGIINDSWGTGVTMVDINQDGWLDIYVCVSGGAEESKRANLLYINNGATNGMPSFTESAAIYGLADTRQSMQAAFFDFDKDEDLDLYLLVNPAAYEHKVNSSLPRKLNGQSISNDRLYRNEGNGKFTDVSLEAGVLVEGYGLGIGIADINKDHWPDIYVSNDFIGNDILYINQKDGTFKDQIRDHIKHTSYAGMGNDIADIDNNGEPDILVLDMRPEDNERQKLIISSTGYDRFQMMLNAGYDPQYSRNTLQLNQGEGKFSEIGFLAGVSSTDWSWSGLLADYDNDGLKDLYVTNGFLRDLGNLDYIHYQGIYDNPLGDRETKKNIKLNSIKELPAAKLVNYAYQNKNGMTFQKVSDDWGIKEASCSNGAAYADLDNDGDLDLLVNNVNQTAFLYENLSDKRPENHFLKIILKGNSGNLNGIGTKIKVVADSSTQYYEHYLSRGYESSVDPVIHFGMGDVENVDEIEVLWPDGSQQKILNVPTNEKYTIHQAEAKKQNLPTHKNAPLLENVTKQVGVDFSHQEDEMVDFKLQPILPHMHSRNGPGIAVGDLNMDGQEDFYIGGAAGQPGQLYLQKEGKFIAQNWTEDQEYEDMACLFFDANNDGFPDLYVVSGGVQNSLVQNAYQDRLYLNDGTGKLTKSNALPTINASGSCVNAIDFDHDGDLDLFVGGRVKPGEYPMPVKSYLLENLADENSIDLKFKDISSSISNWDQLTMVTSALWTDFDQDGWFDLIVVGEFMPITTFRNNQGKLQPNQKMNGLEKSEGWWNSIAGSDFDQDGDIDYLVGNLGLNHKFHASTTEPLCIYANDYDKDGRIDPVMCYFRDGENYLAHTRDEIISQISAMRSRFKTYQVYAETPFEKSFLSEELEKAYVVKSHTFASTYLENKGNGSFEMNNLPLEVQMAPIEGIVIEDVDQDGYEDVLLTGNSFSTEVATGRYDALKGNVLKGKGDGTFTNLKFHESGFLNEWDGSGLSKLQSKNGHTYFLAANNNNALQIFTQKEAQKSKKVMTFDKNIQSAKVIFTDGSERRKELYYGSGYLSQSSRTLIIHDRIKEVETTNFKGEKKKLSIDELK